MFDPLLRPGSYSRCLSINSISSSGHLLSRCDESEARTGTAKPSRQNGTRRPSELRSAASESLPSAGPPPPLHDVSHPIPTREHFPAQPSPMWSRPASLFSIVSFFASPLRAAKRWCLFAERYLCDGCALGETVVMGRLSGGDVTVRLCCAARRTKQTAGVSGLYPEVCGLFAICLEGT